MSWTWAASTEWVRERVGQAAPETLETWSDRLLEADSLQAVFDQ